MRTRYAMAVLVLAGLIQGTAARAASIASGPIVNPANQHTYYLLTADTWTNSEAFAQTLGGNLATINDAAENTWVFQQFGQQRDLWIGLNDVQTEGTFTWASGETSSFTNWRSGQPDNYSQSPVAGEDYVHIYGTQTAFGGLWNDAADNPSIYSGFDFYGDVKVIQGVVEVNPAPLPSTAACGVALLGGCVALRRARRGR